MADFENKGCQKCQDNLLPMLLGNEITVGVQCAYGHKVRVKFHVTKAEVVP